jgi:hypothetical protein
MRICVAQTKPFKADKWLVADRHSTQEWRSLPQSVDVDARRARKRKSCPISLRSDKRLGASCIRIYETRYSGHVTNHDWGNDGCWRGGNYSLRLRPKTRANPVRHDGHAWHNCRIRPRYGLPIAQQKCHCGKRRGEQEVHHPVCPGRISAGNPHKVGRTVHTSFGSDS